VVRIDAFLPLFGRDSRAGAFAARPTSDPVLHACGDQLPLPRPRWQSDLEGFNCEVNLPKEKVRLTIDASMATTKRLMIISRVE